MTCFAPFFSLNHDGARSCGKSVDSQKRIGSAGGSGLFDKGLFGVGNEQANIFRRKD